MVIGAAAQLGRRRIDQFLIGWRKGAVATVSLLGIMALSFVRTESSLVAYGFGGIIVAMFTLGLIWFLREVEVVPAYSRPILGPGVISYAAYRRNHPVTNWAHEILLHGWEYFSFVAIVVLATLNWYLVEKPFNRLRMTWDERSRARETDPLALLRRKNVHSKGSRRIFSLQR